ncbi:MAG: hypothetical protein RQ748_13220, partial [Elusimicrobiales bacterium]|nr:hypothetical protein [Elusimicrobiales bacterium]
GGLEGTFPGAVRAVFLADDLSQSGLTDDTIFVGSNKNNDLVADWRWGSGNNPPKNDVSNAYAYAVLSDENELIIYAGIERLAPNGANHLDFEFNQATISLDNDPPCPTSECEFIGEKTDGDLLVNMDFDQGGNISSVALRQWDAATQQFVLLLAQTPAPGESDAEGCNDPVGPVPGDVLCAFSNNGPIDGGNWPNYLSPGAAL